LSGSIAFGAGADIGASSAEAAPPWAARERLS